MPNDLHDLSIRIGNFEAKLANLEDESDRAREKLHKLSNEQTRLSHFPAVLKDQDERLKTAEGKISSLERSRSWSLGFSAGVGAVAAAMFELLKSIFTAPK